MYSHEGVIYEAGVISFPKSGRTWLRVMLDELGIDAKYTHAGAEHKLGVHFDKLNTRAARRFSSIIFLKRDPKDTAVSGYHQMTKRLDTGYSGSIGDFIRDPHHGVEKIVRFNRMWDELARRRENIVAVSYEQLRENPVEVLKDLTNHLGFSIPKTRIIETVERNTFEKMQLRELSGTFDQKYKGIFGGIPAYGVDGLKCRKGKVNSYAEELSVTDIEYCDALIARLQTELAQERPSLIWKYFTRPSA